MLCAQGGIVDEVPGSCDFDFDVLCSVRCEPCWRDWLRSEVAVSESVGYTTGWMTGTCASAGTDVLWVSARVRGDECVGCVAGWQCDRPTVGEFKKLGFDTF
ncbi:hypothetical protein M405DRAFT_918663 [Rhizopogon salebrosus TDB-379]|nr:hypothetical protein M405DRAFT_918663 [Rhizopogon salebrosus TDB-379]